jgi:hypothetical protein
MCVIDEDGRAAAAGAIAGLRETLVCAQPLL